MKNTLTNGENEKIIVENKAYLLKSDQDVAVAINPINIAEYLQQAEIGNRIQIIVGDEQDCYKLQNVILTSYLMLESLSRGQTKELMVPFIEDSPKLMSLGSCANDNNLRALYEKIK